MRTDRVSTAGQISRVEIDRVEIDRVVTAKHVKVVITSSAGASMLAGLIAR